MAPSKRAAAAPPARASKAAKKEEAAAKPSPCPEEQERVCPEPVLAILDKLAVTAPEQTVSMLRAGLPYILSTNSDDRHAYQVSVLGMWDAFVKDVDAKLVNNVEGCEANSSAVAEEKATRDEKLEQAHDVEAKLLCEKACAEASSSAADAASAEAAAAVTAHKTLLQEAEGALQGKTEERTSYVQALADTWEPLKSCSFAGKDWRLRNKTIDRLSSLLDKAAPSAALAASLPVALKERLDSRGPFTTHVIESAEAAFQEHVQLLQAQEDELRRAFEAQTEALAKAEEVAAEKAETRVSAEKASIDAQNAWVEANTVVFGLKDSKIEQKEAAAAAALQAAHDELKVFRGHVAEYQQLAHLRPVEPASSCAAEQAQEASVDRDEVMVPVTEAEAKDVDVAEPAQEPVLSKHSEVPAVVGVTGAACGA